MARTRFDWDPAKDAENQGKHGVSFSRAQYAFADPQRVIAKDETHSQTEERFYCFGEVDGGVLTVRFTYRASVIRTIGAGYWRKEKAIYERENQIQRCTSWQGSGDSRRPPFPGRIGLSRGRREGNSGSEQEEYRVLQVGSYKASHSVPTHDSPAS